MFPVGRISASVIRHRATKLLDYAKANPTYNYSFNSNPVKTCKKQGGGFIINPLHKPPASMYAQSQPNHSALPSPFQSAYKLKAFHQSRFHLFDIQHLLPL